MGKNKAKSGSKKKDQSVFKVAGSKVNKAKNKAKAVTTNLKKMNFNNKAKTAAADSTLKDVHEALVTKTEKKQQPIKPKPTPQPAPVDVDAAMEDFSKL